MALRQSMSELMQGLYILDDDKKPVPAPNYLVWARFLADAENRQVALDHSGDTVISTVFLGLDLNPSRIGYPRVFETMVFRNGKPEGYCERYSTYKAALQGHKDAMTLFGMT